MKPFLAAILLCAAALPASAAGTTIWMRGNDAAAQAQQALAAGAVYDAIRWGEKALQRDGRRKTKAVAAHVLCIAYRLDGRLAEAAGHCDAAVEADPSDWRAHLNRGAVAFERGRYATARAAFERAEEIAPEVPAVAANLALLREAAGR